jgi:hypothetical protein
MQLTTEINRLSVDKANSLLVTVDDLLGRMCGCSVVKGEGSPVPYETAMAELLLTRWGKATDEVVTRAVEYLADIVGPIPGDDIEIILREVDVILDTKFFDGTEKPLRELFDKSYRKAKRVEAKKLSVGSTFNRIDGEVVDWLTNHHLYWVGKFYDQKVSAAFAETVAEGLREGLGRELMGDRVKLFFQSYPNLAGKPDSYYRMLAANAMNRSRNFGIVQQYK